MSSRIRADFGGFAAAEQGFQTIWQTLEATVDELDATLSAGLAEWTGDAKHAYQDFYDTWHTTARDVAARLDRLRNAVTSRRSLRDFAPHQLIRRL